MSVKACKRPPKLSDREKGDGITKIYKGKFFHTWKDGRIQNQGKVISENSDAITAEMFSWMHGGVTGTKTLRKADYDWTFYGSDKEMRDFASHPTLQCEVRRVVYDFHKRRGELYMAKSHCCDMTGCIKLFEGISPYVEDIQTYSGAQLDTRYVKRGDEWRAIPAEYLKQAA